MLGPRPSRKSRKAVVGSATVERKTAIDTSQINFKELEEILVKEIDELGRRELVELVDRYVLLSEMQPASAKVADVGVILSRGHRHAVKLVEALYRSGKPQLAVDFAQRMIEVRYSRPTKDFTQWLTETIQVKDAIGSALDDLEKRRSNQRDPWSIFIAELTGFCRKRQWRTGVSKDGLSKISPFLLFVKALQTRIPAHMRRHVQSDDALAEGISKARRQPKKGTSA